MNASDLEAENSLLRSALQAANAERDAAVAMVARVRELALKYRDWQGAADPFGALHGVGMVRASNLAGKEFLAIVGEA